MRHGGLSFLLLLNALVYFKAILAAPMNPNRGHGSPDKTYDFFNNPYSSHPTQDHQGMGEGSSHPSQASGYPYQVDTSHHMGAGGSYPDVSLNLWNDPSNYQGHYSASEQGNYNYPGMQMNHGQQRGVSHDPYAYHQGTENVDWSLHLGQSVGSSSSSNPPAPPEAPRQRYRILSQSQSTRPDKLKQYEWQSLVSTEDALRIYDMIIRRWRPAVAQSAQAGLERMDSYLDKNLQLVEPLFYGNEQAIQEVVKYSGPRQIKGKDNAKLALLTPEQIISTLGAPLEYRQPNRVIATKWAPQEMSRETKDKIVDVFHRAWMREKTGVKKTLNKVLKSKIIEVLPFLLSKDKGIAEGAALNFYQFEPQKGKTTGQPQAPGEAQEASYEE